MGMGYNYASGITDGYFVFPYPFFVAVPGYEVTAKGLSEAERQNNLRTLQFIGEEAARRGMRFQLGLWTLAFRWPDSPHATYRIEGLTDDNQAAYCRDALAALLDAVPTVTGVTFRVHEESGIPMGQHSFWETQFSAVTRCGRRVEIDLHAKNMAAETLQFALATGQPTVVSPKYCGEHLGLPYHPASIRDFEMAGADRLIDTGSDLLAGNRTFTRYGYADFLAENRTWDVVFRVGPGTQRMLPEAAILPLFAGYSRSARRFAWRRRYRMARTAFFKGRLGSGPVGRPLCIRRCGTCSAPRFREISVHVPASGGGSATTRTQIPKCYRRALRPSSSAQRRRQSENMLALVSRVLPLFTLAHAQAADCQVYWPDIYTNMPMADMTLPQPDDTRDPRLFGNVSPFDPQLFQSPDECADDLAAGTATGKYSPLEVAQWLEDIAAGARSQLDTARVQLGASVSTPAFRRVEEDVLIQRGIALFFAAKLRSAVLWRLYVATGYPAAGDAAIARYAEGRDASGCDGPARRRRLSLKYFIWRRAASGSLAGPNPRFRCGHCRSTAPAQGAGGSDARGGPRSGRTRIEYCVREGHASDAGRGAYAPRRFSPRPGAGDHPALFRRAACRASLSPRRSSGTLAVVGLEERRRHFLRRDFRCLYGEALPIAVLFPDRD